MGVGFHVSFRDLGLGFEVGVEVEFYAQGRGRLGSGFGMGVRIGFQDRG